MKRSISSADCELIYNDHLSNEIFRLVFVWQGNDKTKLPAPKAGQFFMIKPKRSSVFLGRPISFCLFDKNAKSSAVTFLIAKLGKGTQELAAMRPGEEAELIGPLGNSWMDFLTSANKGKGKSIALVGGGLGVAPLNSLLCESPGHIFDFYAGFKNAFKSKEERHGLLGPSILGSEKIILATEDGKEGQKGLITDFLEPEKYDAVCTCGPLPMMKAVAIKCKAAGVPCYVSMESRMACGVGACLGCTVKTVNGNCRCCADGPIFNANEVFPDE